MKEPQLLFFDIETLPGQFYGFSLGEQRVTWEQIKKEPVVCVICWAINNGKVQSMVFDQSKYNPQKYDDKSDYEILKKFVDIANSADLVIGHNGKNFDIAFLQGRIMVHKLPNIVPDLIDDTYLLTKSKKTLSHKLDYLLRLFSIGQKVNHSGLDMWKGVASKDKKSLQEMKEYCIGDVEGLRKLYYYVKPYIKSNLNLATFYGTPDICPNCSGEETIQKRGFHRTRAGKYQRYQCTSCGWWGHDGNNLISKKITGTASSKYKR